MSEYKQYMLILLGMYLVGYVNSCTCGQQAQSSLYAGWTQYHTGGFSVQIPNTVQINEYQKADFYLYSFVTIDAEKKELLFGYEGKHPSFGQFAPLDLVGIEHEQINGLEAKIIRWKDTNNLFNCEIVVRLLDIYVHFWYLGLSKEDKDLAEKIIQSIQP